MRRQLNTVYVTTEGAWLRKDGENIVMEVEGETRARLPAHMLDSLVCFGGHVHGVELAAHASGLLGDLLA